MDSILLRAPGWIGRVREFIPDTGEWRLNDPNMIINPGDSGGGVYNSDGELIANIRSIEEDGNHNRLDSFRVVPLPPNIENVIQ